MSVVDFGKFLSTLPLVASRRLEINFEVGAWKTEYPTF
jgi:hypothetical protein